MTLIIYSFILVGNELCFKVGVRIGVLDLIVEGFLDGFVVGILEGGKVGKVVDGRPVDKTDGAALGRIVGT